MLERPPRAKPNLRPTALRILNLRDDDDDDNDDGDDLFLTTGDLHIQSFKHEKHFWHAAI